jgi:hypothetical protein
MISVRDAKVKTVAVEVKALTISGKQVTLAVFRQLLKEPLIDLETAELNGIPWGKVNYFWADDPATHLHIVWQKGEELRRDCVYRYEHSEVNYSWARQKRQLAWQRDDLIEAIKALKGAIDDRWLHAPTISQLTLNRYGLEMPKRTYANHDLSREDRENLQEQLDTDYKDALRSIHGNFLADFRYLDNQYAIASQKQVEEQRRVSQLVEELNDIDQLFIAV